ncbi:transporter substrate-binding domain-containing protein [Chitinimonas sp. PSY-7]|uniref:transporter substrate-binding domain-containing protein n=1 Tax=Chitinimonas sp. PSY-7 TaxID=3459088 RepID=UPI00403FF24D
MKLNIIFSALLGLLSLSAAVADDLDEIKKRGTLVVGVKKATPPFGEYNPKSKTISGYDVDFAMAIAKQLGVKIVVKGLEPAQRIPSLQNKEVDMIIATLTKTPEREKIVDFSHGYFVTWQKFVTPVGRVKKIEDLSDKTIGTVTSSTTEKQLYREIPGVNVVLFSDHDKAFAALSKGMLDAVSAEEPILAGLLNKMPNKEKFEIPNLSLSFEVFGIAVRKTEHKEEKRLLKEVNKTIVSMEKSGEASQIFSRWFGPDSKAPIIRMFQISAK